MSQSMLGNNLIFFIDIPRIPKRIEIDRKFLIHFNLFESKFLIHK